LIRTRRGDVAVEALAVGDAVTLHDGGSAPIVWIGSRQVDCARHPSPELVWPVRVIADAFGPGQPRRDLFLSPDHALFADGVLIPVKHLINGHTITQHAVPRIEYWHVELPSHGVMAAEGLSVESLLPGSDRAFFGNGGVTIQLHPRHTASNWEMRGCAPLVVVGPKLQAVRGMLASRSTLCRRVP
jgi:collagen type I/II/III/V/XI/XXIV/XXVII alpha